MEWVAQRRRFCQEAEEGDLVGVSSYEALVVQLKKAFPVSVMERFGKGGFAQFVGSPFLLLFNTLSKAVVFGRPEDWKELQLLMKVLTGFKSLDASNEELLKAAVQRVKRYLLSLHGYIIVAILGAFHASHVGAAFAVQRGFELVKAFGVEATAPADSPKTPPRKNG
ncbi:histidine acid phosphatase superfamily protein [Besnoitia besnoiti]|uniref:Histidine acid phosphatase superfamily protein n=1 Tax=Besnoitia besnoiti TaxID=94643 RepID=A0A2A9MEX3_BESBE|nr:histidine acid phosphatase superfamily protein [Besnoitia besnoiti]PFH33920.1 histidine acid phosphatase superfamily protein [Besnoitia besnoiti]